MNYLVSVYALAVFMTTMDRTLWRNKKLLTMDAQTLGNVPKSLGQLNQLKLLGLQNNLFQNEIPREIWKLKELSALYLDGNRLTGTIPTEVKNLKKMIDLRLRDNRMKGSLPSSLGSLSEFSSKTILYSVF
jgi:Leucine-rich repeat (LRR) protein